MSKFDYLDIDGHLLQLLLAVMETGGITAAAQQLGVTQSAVSHQLDKLRVITGDAICVKSGRGIVLTERALSMAQQARATLSALEQLAQLEPFDPTQWDTVFTIAANDFQRDVLLPPLFRQLQIKARKLVLRVIPSDVPSLEMLRQEQCQLVISPRPPDGTDIMQKRLFVDQYRVFYDSNVRSAPQSLQAYLAAKHMTVLYEPRRLLDIDQYLLAHNIQRNFAMFVPGFAAMPAFLQGSNCLVTAPSLLQRHCFSQFAQCALPIDCPELPMYMVWHMRYQHSAAHRWLRQMLEAVL